MEIGKAIEILFGPKAFFDYFATPVVILVYLGVLAGIFFGSYYLLKFYVTKRTNFLFSGLIYLAAAYAIHSTWYFVPILVAYGVIKLFAWNAEAPSSPENAVQLEPDKHKFTDS